MKHQLFDTAHQALVVDPLAISVVLDAAGRLGGKLKHCLCTLVGVIQDDGTINVTDAFVNHVIVPENQEGAALPERTHHDHCWQQRQKIDPRLIILGWASSDLDFSALDAVSDWARLDQRESRFIPRKRLGSPLLMKIDMPTATSDMDIRVFTKGPIANCLMRPHPFTIAQAAHSLELNALADPFKGIIAVEDLGANANNKSVNVQFLETLLCRVKSAITLVDNIIDGKQTADSTLGRQLHRAIMPPLKVDLRALTKIEAQDNLLAVYVSNLTKLQFAIGEKISLLHA